MSQSSITIKPTEPPPVDRDIEVTVSIVFAESVLKAWERGGNLCSGLSDEFYRRILDAELEETYYAVQAL
jgi:hypothetical protein